MYRVEFQNDEIEAALARISAALTDTSPVMNEIGEQLVVTTEDRFLEGVSPEGAAWAPKSETTIANYRRQGKKVDLRPLWSDGEGGHLAHSFHHAYGQGWVEVGTNAIQSAVMQFGAAKSAFGAMKNGRPIPWGDIPARPFLGISDLDQENIIATVEEWLESIAGDGR